MDYIEQLIVYELVNNKEYSNKIIPFIKEELLDNSCTKVIVKKYLNYSNKYKEKPNWENLLYEISNDGKLYEKLSEETIENIEVIRNKKFEKHNIDWLVDETEKHFQHIALRDAIFKGAEILNDKEKLKKEKHLLPDLVTNALKISFDNDIGKVYGSEEELEKQYYFYHHQDSRFPFPEWEHFNNILRGGCIRKKIHSFISDTNVGKTTALINVASQYLKGNLNVAYVTLEDPEESIYERIDGCLLNTRTEDLPLLIKNDYFNKVKNIVNKSTGKLVVKEFPTASCNMNHIKFFLEEAELIHGIKFDVLIIDYLNELCSTRYANLGDTYTLVKVVSQEMKGLLTQKNLIGWTATQFTRGGGKSSDPGLGDTSESYALPRILDFFIAIIEDDELKERNQYRFKQLKSRYKKITPGNQSWIVGVDKDKQLIYELDKVENIDEQKIEQEEKSKDMNDKFKDFKF